MQFKRLTALLLAVILLCSVIPPAAAADTYQDVPSDSWAVSYIQKAGQYGLMRGQGYGQFGYGKTVTNAEAAQLLCNLMGWEITTPAQPTYPDVAVGKWYYGVVETAHAHGVWDAGSAFQPDHAMTREEMAMAFVKALGLDAAAELEEHQPAQFTDLYRQGYANVAKTIGLMEGTGQGKFSPDVTVKREEAAAMLVRFYEKYTQETEFLHGFYAYSAYSQRDLAKKMDAVTYQWAELHTDGSLDTRNGELKVPESYESIVNYLDGVKQHLGIFMGKDVRAFLESETARTAAVQAILDELERVYENLGKNPYSGVTIDLEGLRGEADKENFNAFLTELSEGLKARGKTLYVAVQGALHDSTYFDGFDFRTIGRLSDKVILMAHDYAPMSMAGFVGTVRYEKAALTPIQRVYYSLKMALDAETGIEDAGKLVLAFSMDAQGWQLDENNKISSETRISVGVKRMAEILAGDRVLERDYSNYYQNPYAIYENEAGERVFVWYEDARSLEAKTALAKCFGVTGVSVWRLGNIPNTAAYDVTAALF